MVSIVGTRPEAIKMAPVVRAIEEHADVSQLVLLTGQHSDLERSFDFLPLTALERLDVNTAEQTAGEIREGIHHALCRHPAVRQADLVLVQGDTSSALAGALAARDCGVPVGHVEAGLRSFDRQQPWPEEGNRVEIDAIADLLFAPSEDAARNLGAEPAVTGTVYVTGNSGIDAVLHARARSAQPPASVGRRIILVTCHRRENRGRSLRGIAGALKRLARELPVEIVLPLHPNRHVRGGIEHLLGSEPHIHLIEPLDHQQMVGLMDRSWLILTDSGGIQEEGPALGKPVLVLRNVTERSEAVASSNVELVGTDPDRIFDAVCDLFADGAKYQRMSAPAFPFGDGRAAPRIARIVDEFLTTKARDGQVRP